MTFDTSQGTEVEVTESENSYYICTRPDRTLVGTKIERWLHCGILMSGQTYDEYIYQGEPGTLYYTWTMELKGKKVRTER